LSIAVKKMIKAAYKIWFSKNDEKAFGRGPCELLRRVEKTNSLNQAAHQMHMSYNKAWRLIRLMEKRLGFPLLDKKIGGQSGGGSWVTPRAKDFIERYERFEMDAMRAIEKAYRKHFGSRSGRRGGR
jgi:molybdate transport system regulatory protein